MTIFHTIKWPIDIYDTGDFSNHDIVKEMMADPDGQRILSKWRKTITPKGMNILEELADIIANWDSDPTS